MGKGVVDRGPARLVRGLHLWLGSYVERAENLARIIDVNETFSRDSRGGQNWLSILQLNSDEKRFFAAPLAATARSVLKFYVVRRCQPDLHRQRDPLCARECAYLAAVDLY